MHPKCWKCILKLHQVSEHQWMLKHLSYLCWNHLMFVKVFICWFNHDEGILHEIVNTIDNSKNKFPKISPKKSPERILHCFWPSCSLLSHFMPKILGKTAKKDVTFRLQQSPSVTFAMLPNQYLSPYLKNMLLPCDMINFNHN